MKKFLINQTTESSESPFDRQERISWWSQEKISRAKVMVVGAGAIGNETLKNLALLGFKNFYIVDFDTVSISNLSRTILFRKEDLDQKKAQVAAERTRDLCLAENPEIYWFHGDIVWELGTGIFREMDIILGCLDNAETRFAINRQSWLSQTPWIDAGIYELGGAVSVYVPNEPPCYQCGASEEQILAARQRYSCDEFKRSVITAGKVPTVQIASAIASAIQVQEAIKIVCGQQAAVGKKIYFQGKINDFGVLNYSINPDCLAHATYPEITSLLLTNRMSLADFLTFVEGKEFSGDGATLDFSGDRNFVTTGSCKRCARLIEFFKPSFRIYDYEAYCNGCGGEELNTSRDDPNKETVKESLYTFSLDGTDARILGMSLHDLGVPPFHVVSVMDKDGRYKYYELSKDRDELLKQRA